MKLRRTLSRVLVAVLAGAGLAAVPVVSLPSAAVAAAPTVTRDGSSSARAAASCWEIKQHYPSSPDGVYWLQTPQLVAPQQFYCDQTTDGGGWVLIGRGRDGWQWTNNGQSTAAAVSGTPSGTAAFAPATVSAAAVDGLLGGTRVDALTDGIRIRRATNEAGTSYQELRLLAAGRANWSWAIGGGIHLSSVSVNGTSYPATNSQVWADGTNQGLLRLNTSDQLIHDWHQGFSYGNTIGGENNSTSYLWEYTNENQAIPFTQVWIRPKVLSPSYPAIADSGTAATTVRALLGNKTSPTTTWGVTGVATGGQNGEVVEVEDFAFIGRTVYVAGRFRYVKHGAAGDDIDQPYLASFNIDTGDWNSAFRPKLDATAWSLAATPDGKLFVGGEFSSVNGVANTSGLAELDPTTGAPVPGWRATATYQGNDAPNVRAIGLQGSWLYVGGRFNRLAGGKTIARPLTLRSMARVNLTDGTPDANWKPNVDGTVFELDPSPKGDRVYFVGNFDNVDFDPSPMRGVVSTATGAPNITGLANWIQSTGSHATGKNPDIYQQTILEVGDDVWQGGSQHILTRYNRSDYKALNSNITRNGGDFQALDELDGVVYGSCHCVNYAYSGTYNFSTPIASASDVNGIRFIGAWDAKTGAYIPDFFVSSLSARNDMGPWALKNSPDGCMYFGGDFVAGSFNGSSHQWLGGFGKLCPRDTTAPTVPTGLKATPGDSGVSLSWGGSSDASSIKYEVLRGDRVVATVNGTSWTDPDSVGATRYWVRAVDSDGNRSASTPDVAVTGDVNPPSQVQGLTGTAATAPSRVSLSWQPATDDKGVVGYVVNRNGGALPGTVTGLSFTDTLAKPSTAYTYTVQAKDAAGNLGPASATVPVTTGKDASVVYANSWTAKNGAGWSKTWVKATKSGSFSTTSDRGTVNYTNHSGAYAKARLNEPARTNSELLTSFRWTTATASSYLTFYLRGSGGWQNTYAPKNGYGVQISPLSTTVTTLRTSKGSTASLGTTTLPSLIGTTREWLRFRVTGTTIEYKLWAATAPEPSAWTSVRTSKAVTAKGQMSISLRRNSTNKGSKSVEIDDLAYRSK